MGHHLRSLQFLEYSHSKSMCVSVSPILVRGGSCRPSRVCIAWETTAFQGKESLQWPSLGSCAPTELLLILVTFNSLLSLRNRDRGRERKRDSFIHPSIHLWKCCSSSKGDLIFQGLRTSPW